MTGFQLTDRVNKSLELAPQPCGLAVRADKSVNLARSEGDGHIPEDFDAATLIFDRAKFDQDFGFSDWLTCLPHLLNLSLYRHRHRPRRYGARPRSQHRP